MFLLTKMQVHLSLTHYYHVLITVGFGQQIIAIGPFQVGLDYG
jgi:hypothetical protein